MSSQQSLLMGLLTETSLHAGVGQNIDVIDLPIQREAHTDYPCVFGSAVKGALRTLATTQNKYDNKNLPINELFGDEGNEYAGALIITDARLLLLPVRSLTSHFKWVTCPYILERLKNDCERLDLPNASLLKNIIPNPDKETALMCQKNDGLFLEEFHFKTKSEDLGTIIEIIAQFMGRDDAKYVLEKQLVIIHDDMFRLIAKSATPVNAHIAIDIDTKTAKGGALWYEETLPPDTLLYAGIVANASRKSITNEDTNGSKEKICHLYLESAGKIKGCFKGIFEGHSYLQLGGNETVGMGWCKVKFYPE